MAQLSDKEKSLAGKLTKFFLFLLAFLGIEAVNEVLQEITEQAKAYDPNAPKPSLQEVGDTLLDALADGGELIPDEAKRTTFERWIGIIKGGWDAIQGGAGPLIALFKGLIHGHEAVQAEKATS